MRVLFLDDAVFDDLPGGSRVVARSLVQGLARRGHEVTMLVPRHAPQSPDDERRDGVRIVRYGGAGNPLAFVREGRAACARLWAEGAFDIVHTHFAYAAIGPLQAVPRPVPRIRTFHGPWDEEGWSEDAARSPRGLGLVKASIKKLLRFQIEAANLRRSDRVIVLSEFFREEVQRRFGVAPARITKIPGGVDLARFVLSPEPGAARTRLGLPQDRSLLLSVRRLTPRMGLDNLICAMPAIIAQCPDVLLLIGGKGPERDTLARLIAAHGLENHVRLLGFIADEQLAAYYGAADAFVLPTVALEGFGLVTVEALACGTPVVGTPVGATPEILSALDARLVTASATSDALAQGLLSFLQGDWRQALTPQRLREFVQQRYTWERTVEQTEALYHSLVGKAALSVPKDAAEIH